MGQVAKLQTSRLSYYWVFYIFLQGLIIVGIISTFYTQEWTVGLGMKSSLRKISYNDEDYNIIDEVDKICKGSDSSFHCKASKRLLEGEYFYFVFSGISCFFTLMWIVCSVLLSIQKNFYVLGCACGFITFFSYILAVFLWIFRAKVGLNRCENKINAPSSQGLCFGSGFKFNLSVIAYIPVVLYIFFLLGGITLKKLKIGYMSINEEPQGMPERAVDETSIHSMNRFEIDIPSK